MPSLGELLATFPGRHLLINVKSNDEREGKLLAGNLNGLPAGYSGGIWTNGIQLIGPTLKARHSVGQ